MEIAEVTPVPDRSDESYAHLSAVLRFKVDNADLKLDQIGNLISIINAVERKDG